MNESENNPEVIKDAVVDSTPVTEEVVVTKVTEVVEVEAVSPEALTSETPIAAAVGTLSKVKWQYYAVAVAIVVVLLGGLVYVMEQQGRLQTGIFSGVQKMVAGKTSVATVNGNKITRYDLDISVAQISAGAVAQGADIANPEIKAQIQTQAIDMLVNTELLKQEAASRGITITDEQVTERLETLKTDVGGEEVLAERMKEFKIDEKTLVRDIKNELTIQALLDIVFAEKSIAVTDAEITEFYNAAGGAEAELPPLAEVREQIEAQIKSTKEQEVVTAFVEELRGKGTVEILI